MAAVTPPSRATAASVAAVIIAALALLSTTHRASVAGLSAHGQLVTAQDAGTRAALDRIDVGGTAGNAFMATGLAVMADAQVWTRALSAAEVTTDWEAARAAMGR